MNQQFIAFFLLACAAGAANANKVPVTIYYESLCPDSAKFITQQVYPALKTPLRDYVDIMWVPFGKSTFKTIGSDVTFLCNHGPDECYGNKVHACAIEKIEASSYQAHHTSESLLLDFINCMMKIGKNFPDNVYPGRRCAQESSVAIWELLAQCANSTEGSQLLKKNGEITQHFQAPLKNVPTVVFRQQYDSTESERAQENFLQVACKYVPQPLPPVCSQINGSGALNAAFFVMLPLAFIVALLNMRF